jgi:hypothetical protein
MSCCLTIWRNYICRRRLEHLEVKLLSTDVLMTALYLMTVLIEKHDLSFHFKTIYHCIGPYIGTMALVT